MRVVLLWAAIAAGFEPAGYERDTNFPLNAIVPDGRPWPFGGGSFRTVPKWTCRLVDPPIMLCWEDGWTTTFEPRAT